MRSRRAHQLAVVGLLTVAITWGTTFPLSKSLLTRMSVWDLLALRFGAAAVVMLVCFVPAVAGSRGDHSAMIMQSRAQAHLTPARTAVIMATEPVLGGRAVHRVPG